MASSVSFIPCSVPLRSAFPHRTRPQNHTQNLHFPGLRTSVCVARFGLRPDVGDGSEFGFVELFRRAEGLFYTIADAAISSSENVTSSTKQNSDWFSGITNYMETVLKVLESGLSTLHVPYAYGFAIILLTVLVKGATFPLTKKQVESAMAMRALQPQIKAIQQRYAGDQERIQLETARLYKLAGINPFAGCLPTLATIPVWIGLYRALSNVADEGLLAEGFFWIPSLAGPTTVASRQNGSGISWLFPFVDGHPPLGWSDTLKYLVLPLLLVASQYLSVQIMQSSQPQSDDPNMKNSQAITQFLPLMIGYFALSVPSGLSLYWLTNNILSTAQQVWLQKLGGAQNPVRPLNNDIIKEEPSRLLKSLTELNSSVVEAKLEEKQTQEGPRPGDRFRQIKEQEAKRKKEEERRKAELVVAEAYKITGSEHVTAGTADEENGTASGLGNENEENNKFISSQEASNGVVVNGNVSSQKPQEDQQAASSVSQEKNE